MAQIGDFVLILFAKCKVGLDIRPRTLLARLPADVVRQDIEASIYSGNQPGTRSGGPACLHDQAERYKGFQTFLLQLCRQRNKSSEF